MNILTIILFIVILLFVILLIKGFMIGNNSNYKLSDLRLLIDCLLKRGFDGGTLILSEKNSGKLLQYKKYIINNSNYGIQMDFPKAEWSQTYFYTLKKYLDKKSVKYEYTKSTNEKGLDFISIDFKNNIEFAVELSQYIFEQIMNIDKSESLKVEYENVSPWNETITSKNHKLLKLKEGVKTIIRKD